MCRERFDDEQGIALISVMLAVLILSGLVTVWVARSVNETTISRHSRDRETAIHAAEAATDKQLAEITACPPPLPPPYFPGCDDVDPTTDEDYEYLTLDETGARVQYDAAAVASERDWALSLLSRMDGDTTSGLAPADGWVQTDNGEAFAVRPYDPGSGYPLNLIFGVGAVPSFGHPDARVRVIKLQIDRDFYSPRYAVLTDGDLTFGGNARIVSPDCIPAAPVRDDCQADVHANEDFQNPGGASSVQGRITVADGTCPPVNSTFGCQGSGDGVTEQKVPEVRARSFYGRELQNLNPDQGGQPMDWFDLCPDGTVRPVSADGPCTSTTVIWPDPATPEGSTTSFRGWKHRVTGGGVQWSSTAVGAGVFYVYHADASINGTSGDVPRAVSVFVEQNPADKSRTGSLSISGNPDMEGAFPDVLVVTDADLDLNGNATVSGCGVVPESMSGFLSVREQFKTQGTTEVRGAVLVQDVAQDHPLVQDSNDGINGTMCLEYDKDLDIDIDGLFTITFWNEL
jgi:hypothetical protein